MEMNGLLHTPAVLSPGRALQYTLNGRSVIQSRSGYAECVIFFYLMSEKRVNLLRGSIGLPVCIVKFISHKFSKRTENTLNTRGLV